MRDNHEEDIDIFGKKVDLEKTLKKQVVSTIYKLCTKKLIYSQTYTIIVTVDEHLTHLFEYYGLFNAKNCK